jgi:ribosomal protein L29
MWQSSGKVKTGQLWSKNKADLAKQLGELKTELGQLRTQKIAGGSASKLTKMCVYPICALCWFRVGIGIARGRDEGQQMLMNFSLQPRSPKVNRKGPYSHQRQPTLTTPSLLQEQEVPTPWSPTKANPGYSKTFEQAREREDPVEDEEAGDSLPSAEVCHQGRRRNYRGRLGYRENVTNSLQAEA